MKSHPLLSHLLIQTHTHIRGEDCFTNELVWLPLSYGHERMVGPHPSAAWESVLSAPNATGCQGPELTDLSTGNCRQDETEVTRVSLETGAMM